MCRFNLPSKYAARLPSRGTIHLPKKVKETLLYFLKEIPSILPLLPFALKTTLRNAAQQ